MLQQSITVAACPGRNVSGQGVVARESDNKVSQVEVSVVPNSLGPMVSSVENRSLFLAFLPPLHRADFSGQTIL